MRELIFCCPNCLVVDSTGVAVDSDQTLRKIQHRPMHLQCKHCHRWIFVSVDHTMVSGLLEGPDKFARLNFP